MIIGVSGKRGVGKTVFARYLRDYHGYAMISFADALRDHCEYIWGTSFLEHIAAKGKEIPYKNDWTPRDFMILYGDLIRSFEGSYWVQMWMKRAMELDAPNIVVDDLRFANEYHFLVGAKATLIRIERDPKLNIYRGKISHASETELDDKPFDYVITEDNNIALVDLEHEAEEILEMIGAAT